MNFSKIDNEIRWQNYLSGYQAMIRSGAYFRQLVRPVFSHIHFQRAMPLVDVYAESNRGSSELPPGFGDQMNACPVTMRDLLHLDYAISLGFAESETTGTLREPRGKVLEWPGPSTNGSFTPVDALIRPEEIPFDLGPDFDFDEDDDPFDDDEDEKPFDL